MSQGVAIYITYTTDVLLICWFGTQLTQHVRMNTYCQSKNAACKVLRKVQHFRELQIDFKSFILKCFRRRVWETWHSGATGWELLFHFSDVWCSSSLELTRSSNWQLESLFRCQISLPWMYVYMWVYLYMYVGMYVHSYVCTYLFIYPAIHETINALRKVFY